MLRPTTPTENRKLVKLATRSLTRAHLALSRRPTLKSAVNESAQAVAAALSKRLGAEVELEASLLDAAVRGPASLACPGAFALIALDEVGGFAVAELEPQLASALVDRLAGGLGEALAPQPLSESEEAGTSLLLLDVLAALRGSPMEKALGPRLVRIVQSAAEVSASTDLRAAHLAIRARLSCGNTVGQVRVLVPASALRNWLESSAPDVLAPATGVAAAGLPFAVRAGRAVLTPDDLETLVAGDVVLLDALTGPRDALSGAARLVGARFTLAGELGADGFSVETLSLQEQPMNSEATQVMKSPELPVDVDVELAHVRLTIAELGAIQPGGVIPLRISVGEPVTLRVGDSAVAIAELVEIDGEIGARILRLCK